MLRSKFIRTSLPRPLRLSIYLLCCFALLSVLAACGGSVSVGNANIVPTAPGPATLSQTYQGNDFSINYPADWKKTTNGNAIAFVSSGQVSVLNVIIVDNSQASSADDAITKAITARNLTNVQDAQLNSPTVTIGGVSWQQKAITGTNSQGNAMMYVVAVTSYPANDPSARWFLITRETGQANFDQVDTDDFQPMIDTFKFAS